jgi:uncharacterized phage protein gp47/JayE
MSLNLPSNITGIYTKLANDVKSLITKANPFKKNSLTKAILVSFAGRVWDYYKQVEAFIDQMFDDTRTGIYLERECADYGITRNSATVAKGNISVMGTAGETVPLGTEFIINSLVYTVDTDTDISEKSYYVVAAYDDGVVTLTFYSDEDHKTLVAHGLGTGQEITVSGMSNSELNGDFEVSVLSATTLSYTADIAGSGSDSGISTYSNAVVAVTSDGFGEDYNLGSGEVLTIGASLENIDNEAVVVYTEITGGTDEESDTDLRPRLQQRKKNPSSFFNSAEVEARFLTLSWVKRVFIKRVTPAVGNATIYLVKEDNGIPSAGEITTAKAFFEPYLPINCDFTIIIVSAPSENAIAFTFSALDPDTSTMRAAIEANLEALFLERSEVGETITEAAYLGVIANTVDPSTLERVSTFTLDSPSGDIDPDDDELSTYDGTTWSI